MKIADDTAPEPTLEDSNTPNTSNTADRIRPAGPVLPVIDMEQFERERRLLPPMPEVMNRIDSLIRSGKTEVAEITEVVLTEVSLVARILRVVNSAYYSIPREISDIKQAVAFLGFTEIHRLVLTSSIADTFKDANPVQLRRFWTHSYYTALISKELSRRYEKQLDVGELWPCALLHDLGELVYMRLYGEHYSALLQFQLDDKCLIDDAEDALNLPSHRVLGAELCKHWKLPAAIADVCANHGASHYDVPADREDQRAIRRLVTAADLLSSLVVESLRIDLEARCREDVKHILGCDESDLLRLMGDVLDLRPEVDRLLGD